MYDPFSFYISLFSYFLSPLLIFCFLILSFFIYFFDILYVILTIMDTVILVSRYYIFQSHVNDFSTQLIKFYLQVFILQ
jgi:hypothetical protein